MWRVVTSTIVALSFFASVAAAQQPCTTDARRVVSEVYRHILERAPDAGARDWEQALSNGRMNVRELVRTVAKSQEHIQRFGQTESGEGMPYERAVARFYRHILGRQPDEGGQRAHAQGAQQSGLGAVVDALVNSQEYTNSFGDWGVPGSGGVNFCATNGSTSAAAPQVQADTQLTEPRFRGMDTNRDGVISTREWRGSQQSFRVHDWDGNGVLERDEVRQGGFRRGRTLEDEDFDRDDNFEYLDANNNGRIEPREWHASLNAFNRMDRNGDGALTRAEVAANTGTNRGVATTGGDFIVVDSSVRWTDTGITVRVGDTLTFDAEGQITLSDNRNDIAIAGGAQSGRRATNAPVANAPAGGLIARIGNGNPVYVGNRRAPIRASANGRLYLGVNDDYLADNQGEYRVTIDVR
jgi:hypothetical protein